MVGTETTALALSTAIFHMTKQPDLWLELDRQLRASLPDGSRDEYLDITALEKVSLLDATAKESLRVGCPIPGSLPRVVPEGGWQLRGEMIPAGVRQIKPFPTLLKAMCSANFRILIVLCAPKHG
jgi:cytochrome P450